MLARRTTKPLLQSLSSYGTAVEYLSPASFSAIQHCGVVNVFSAPDPELFTLGISMLYAGTSVEEAFRVQSLVSTPPLQNLMSSTKSHPTSTTLQIWTFFLQSQIWLWRKKVPQSEEFTIPFVKIGSPINWTIVSSTIGVPFNSSIHILIKSPIFHTTPWLIPSNVLLNIFALHLQMQL